MAELVTLARVLELIKDNAVNIDTDSDYTYLVVGE